MYTNPTQDPPLLQRPPANFCKKLFFHSHTTSHICYYFCEISRCLMLILQIKKLRLVEGNEPHWTHQPSDSALFFSKPSCLKMHHPRPRQTSGHRRQRLPFTNVRTQDFSRELDQDGGAVPIQGFGGRDAQNVLSLPVLEVLWMHMAGEPHFNTTVLHGPRIRDECGVLGVKTPDLPPFLSQLVSSSSIEPIVPGPGRAFQTSHPGLCGLPAPGAYCQVQ